MKIIQPTWCVPSHVHALMTTRLGGVSQAPFDSLNLGDHVGDNPDDVAQNRQRLAQDQAIPAPIYLTQTHSVRVLRLPLAQNANLEADAVYTDQPNQTCLVMTADCLPVIFCSRDGQQVAAAHAGWRGLCDGILEATVAEFSGNPQDIQVWLGAAIGPTAFQVGKEVVEQFAAVDKQAREAFKPDPNEKGKFLGDLYHIARQRLSKLGITEITGGDYCTYSDAEHFFSYRRDHTTGRMATLIWRSE